MQSFGIYYASLGNFPAAIIGLIWAVFFDWSDGIIARQMKGRTDEQRAFGKQLDSLIDIVSFGILPAVLLLSYGEFSPLVPAGGVHNRSNQRNTVELFHCVRHD